MARALCSPGELQHGKSDGMNKDAENSVSIRSIDVDLLAVIPLDSFLNKNDEYGRPGSS